jgi:hypothetical protein
MESAILIERRYNKQSQVATDSFGLGDSGSMNKKVTGKDLTRKPRAVHAFGLAATQFSDARSINVAP